MPTAAKHYTPEDAIEYDKVYKIRALRLKFRYSQYETSWLLGYRDYYVRDVENPMLKLRYSAVDTNYFRLIFNCPIADVIAPIIDPPKWYITVENKEDKQGKNIYKIYKLEDGKKKLYQTVKEEDKLIFYPTSNTTTQEEVNTYTTELMNGDFFNTARTHLEIFRKNTDKFGASLKPLLVINAIAAISRRHKYPKLTIGEATSTGRETIVKVEEGVRCNSFKRVEFGDEIQL